MAWVRFAGGILAGLTAFVLAFGLLDAAHYALRWRNDPFRGRPEPVRLAGSEASRLGAARVEIGFHDRRVREDCRGGCDDLMTTDTVESLRLSGMGGRVVLVRRSGVWSGDRVSGAPLEQGRLP